MTRGSREVSGVHALSIRQQILSNEHSAATVKFMSGELIRHSHKLWQKLMKGSGPMAELPFYKRAKLSKRTMVLGNEEVRVVSKTSFAAGIGENASSAGAFCHNLNCAGRVRKGNAADVSGTAFVVRNVIEFAK